ncbi:MAG: hypothetical protein JW742_01880 [Candidatus Aminicenantes bacterium]|nr:hypothetical protein [Candidatus Aminicenantes bacterium]
MKRQTGIVKAGALAAVVLLAAPLFLSADGAVAVSVVAAGQVNTDGSIQQGFNVVKAVFVEGGWRIRLKGPAKDFSYRDFVTVVTPIGSDPLSASMSSIGGRLVVYIQDLDSGSHVKENFSFVVYQIKS